MGERLCVRLGGPVAVVVVWCRCRRDADVSRSADVVVPRGAGAALYLCASGAREGKQRRQGLIRHETSGRVA